MIWLNTCDYGGQAIRYSFTARIKGFCIKVNPLMCIHHGRTMYKNEMMFYGVVSSVTSRATYAPNAAPAAPILFMEVKQ